MGDESISCLKSKDITLNFSNIEVIQPHGTLATATKSENKIQFCHGGESGHYFVACTPSLNGSGDGAFWKVTVNELTHSGGWVFFGILRNLNASKFSFGDSTAYGWAGMNQAYIRGMYEIDNSGWTQFTQGECLYFRLTTTKLSMYSVQKNRKFT